MAASYFQMYDVTTWLLNNYNAHIAQHPRNKSSKTMKFCQLIEYNKRDIFIRNYTKNVGLVLDLFLSFKKVLYETKVRCLQFSFNIFR